MMEENKPIILGNYKFDFVEYLEPQKDENGKILEFKDIHKNYLNKKNLVLHQFGNEIFCKFKLKTTLNTKLAGLYLWVVENEIIYIGETLDFKTRFNSQYGNISPRNCFSGGQRTNCKMNSVLLKTIKQGKQVKLYFCTCDATKRKEIETRILLDYKNRYGNLPSYNAKV